MGGPRGMGKRLTVHAVLLGETARAGSGLRAHLTLYLGRRSMLGVLSMTIGELARRAAVNTQTIRFYEREGARDGSLCHSGRARGT